LSGDDPPFLGISTESCCRNLSDAVGVDDLSDPPRFRLRRLFWDKYDDVGDRRPRALRLTGGGYTTGRHRDAIGYDLRSPATAARRGRRAVGPGSNPVSPTSKRAGQTTNLDHRQVAKPPQGSIASEAERPERQHDHSRRADQQSAYAPDRVRVDDFTIYRDSGEHTAYEATGDLIIRNADQEYGRLRVPPEGQVAVILGVGGDDFCEVLVDQHVNALAQLDRALFRLRAARDQLAAMLAADALTTMAAPQTVEDVVDAAEQVGVMPSDVLAAMEADSEAIA
jgi:hypothetical protein